MFTAKTIEREEEVLYLGGGNSHRLGYRMCYFLRVLFVWLENKFLGLFYSL